jgi:hypothetical protein
MHLKGDSEVVVFEDALVVVHDGEVGTCVDEELVGDAGVIDVVDRRREDGTDCL